MARNQYDDEFKISTVKAWRASGLSAPKFSKQSGIIENNLYNWAKKFETSDGVMSADVSAELQRLRKENAQLRTEAEILKKAMGYFAKPK